MMLNFGINPQAQAVALLVVDFKQNSDIKTVWPTQLAPWYNGRECGVSFSQYVPQEGTYRVAIVFEHRNSDSLCVHTFEVEHLLNPPNIHQHLELVYPSGDKYQHSACFSYGQFCQAADFITNYLYENIEDE